MYWIQISMFFVRLRTFIPLIIALALVGCAASPTADIDDDINTTEGPSDPFEGFNRAMWTFNYQYLDPYLVRPVSLAYVDYTPVPVRTGISNFLSNLDEPSSMVNDLLMGNGELAFNHFNRFWINSIFGLLGLIDVAEYGGLHREDERVFSDVAGHYGVGNGPYFVVPAYGPVTTREATNLVDGLYMPLSYLTFWGKLGKWAFEGLESRAQLATQESLLENSPDSYIFARDIYLQRRDYKAQITTETIVDDEEEDFLDDYLDE